MEPIHFDNLYDLLSVELGRPVDKVREGVDRNSEEVAEAAARSFGSQKFKFTLLEPINTPEGSMTLLAAGSDLGTKISAIIGRQAKDTSTPLGPIIFAPEDGMVGHFRSVVLDRLTPAMDEYKTDPPPHIKRVFLAVKPALRPAMDGIVERTAAKCLTGSQGLMSMLQAVRNEGFDGLWKRSLQSSYMAMSVMSAVSELADDREMLPLIEKTGKAGLMQDLAIMLKPNLYAKDTVRHPSRSSQIASSMGFEEPVCELIENHHRYMAAIPDEEGAKDAQANHEPGAKALSPEAKVLVVANLFISALNDQTKVGGDIEAIKGLNFLMAEGKVDKRAVVTLTRLYLSRKFALFFEKATEIKTKCPHDNIAEPILWNILGERNPQKFICNFKDCAHLGSQQTLVSQTIPVKFDDKVVAKIRKGEYYACRYLTGELANLYKEVAVLNTK